MADLPECVYVWLSNVGAASFLADLADLSDTWRENAVVSLEL
jgi:hypothetical protein